MRLYPTKYGPVLLKRGLKCFISAPFLSVISEILRIAGVDAGKCEAKKDGPLVFTVTMDRNEIQKVAKALEKPVEKDEKPLAPNRTQVMQETIRRTLGGAGELQSA